jgi:hypothetical protein
VFQLKQESDVIGFYQFLFTNNQHMLIDIVYFVRVMDGYLFFHAGNRSPYRCYFHQISDHVNEGCFCHRHCYRWQKYCLELWALPGVFMLTIL